TKRQSGISTRQRNQQMRSTRSPRQKGPKPSIPSSQNSKKERLCGTPPHRRPNPSRVIDVPRFLGRSPFGLPVPRFDRDRERCPTRFEQAIHGVQPPRRLIPALVAIATPALRLSDLVRTDPGN